MDDNARICEELLRVYARQGDGADTFSWAVKEIDTLRKEVDYLRVMLREIGIAPNMLCARQIAQKALLATIKGRVKDKPAVKKARLICAV